MADSVTWAVSKETDRQPTEMSRNEKQFNKTVIKGHYQTQMNFKRIKIYDVITSLCQHYCSIVS